MIHGRTLFCSSELVRAIHVNDGDVATNIEFLGVKTSPREKNIYKRNSVIVMLRSSSTKQINMTEIANNSRT